MHDRDHAERTYSRGDLLLTTLSLALPVALYNLLLLERKYSVLFGRGAFLQEPLVGREKLAFLLVFLIFPALLLVILGPAGIQLFQALSAGE
jgi:hypothetical protein